MARAYKDNNLILEELFKDIPEKDCKKAMEELTDKMNKMMQEDKIDRYEVFKTKKSSEEE